MPPRRVLQLETLCDVLDGKVFVHCHSYRADEILMIIRVAEDFGFKVRTFQHVLEGYKVAGEIAKHGAGASTFSDWWTYKMEVRDAIPYNAAILAAHGVRVSLNSDSTELARRMYWEAAKVVKYGGVSETEALKMITLNPAGQLGIDDRVGSLEVGKDADIAVFSAHPFSPDARVDYTLVDGTVYFDRAKDLAARKHGHRDERTRRRRSGTGFASAGRRPGGALPAVSGPLAAAAARAETIAIIGGHVVPVSAPEIEGGTILISKGKIEAIGKDVVIPEGARVIDAAGQFVYPGLIDGLTTLGLWEIGSVAGTVDVQEVGDVNPHAKAWVAVNPHSDLIPVTRANGVTAALTAPTGGRISGQSALIRMAGTTPMALTIKAPVAMHVNYPSGRRSSADKSGSGKPKEKKFADRQKEKKRNQEKGLKRLANLLEEAKAYGAALDAARAGKIAPPKADPPLEALVPAARGQVPVVMRADDADDIRGAVKFASEHALKLIVAGGLEAWRCTSELKKADVPVLLTPNRRPRRESDSYDASFANARLLHAAGVRFAIVTGHNYNARNLPYEAAMARAFGLPAAEALRSITLSPATIFGVADRMGSLAPGKDANVIVASGDIMDHRTVVTRVFIDGVEQSLETRHTRLYNQFKDRP